MSPVSAFRATPLGERLFWAAYYAERGRLSSAPSAFRRNDDPSVLTRDAVASGVPSETVQALVASAENVAMCDHYGSDG